MTDERAERLRKRRRQSSRKVARESGAGSDTAPKEEESPTQERDERGESAEETRNSSVKEERTGTYMYLPDSQLKDLKRQYNVLKAEYEFEFDERFEKNRHFYPLAIQYGLDSLEKMDVHEIKEKLDTLE